MLIATSDQKPILIQPYANTIVIDQLEELVRDIVTTLLEDSLSWNAASTGTVTTTAVDLLAADPNRKAIILHNSSANDLLVSFGSTATATSALYKLSAGQTLIEKESFVVERLSAIAVSDTVSYSLRVA